MPTVDQAPLSSDNPTDRVERRSIITEEQKKELILFYNNGMTRNSSPLVAAAAEGTGLTTSVIENWIGNYKRTLKQEHVPVKEIGGIWPSLDDGQKTKYNTEAATVNAAYRAESEQRELTIKRHLKQLQIEVSTLEQLGVEMVIVAFDTLQADMEVLEFGSKRATTFLDSTDTSTRFALHLKDQMTSKKPQKRKSVDTSLAVLTAVNDPTPSKKKAVNPLSSAVPSAGHDLKSLPGVCEESSFEHQEGLVKEELEPLQINQRPTGDDPLSSDGMLPQHHTHYTFSLDEESHTDIDVRRSNPADAPGSSHTTRPRQSTRIRRLVRLGSTSPHDSDQEERWDEERSDDGWEPTFLTERDACPAHLFSDQEEEDEIDQEMADAMDDASIAGDNAQPTTSSSAAASATMEADGDKPSGSPGWSSVGWQAYQIPFTGEPGPRCDLHADSDPVSFLELFLTDQLLQHICNETNLYAAQCVKLNPEEQRDSRVRRWKDVDVPELKNFFGLYFLMGVVRKPSLEAYWSAREAGCTPHFARTMFLPRFELLKRLLRFNHCGDTTSSSDKDVVDRLHKVRPVLDHLLDRFREAYTPGRNIAIDEGIMPWRGRNMSFKALKYNQAYRTYGLKSHCLLEAETGYLWNMQPYTGECRGLNETVTDLLRDLAYKGYHLYMRETYNSVERCELLQALGTQVCGAMRVRRVERPEIKRLKLGETAVRHNNDGVMVLAWRDTELVKMCNTIHPHAMLTASERKKGQKKEEGRKQKPACVVAYNKYMSAVDKIDKQLACYAFAGKTMSWPQKFVLYMFQLAFHNAFVLQKAKGGKVRYLLDFIMLAVEKWTAERSPVAVGVGEEEEWAARRSVPSGPRDPPRARRTDPASRLTVQFHGHVLTKLRSSRDCRLHKLSGIRRATLLWCQRCDMPLCVECYFIYHSEENIKHYFD